MIKKNRAVFLDRDGVINHLLLKMGKPRAPYSLEEFSFIEGVEEAIQLLKLHDLLLIVVTNQPDVARGWVGREKVDLVNEHVKNFLQIDEVKTCFHTENETCECRKPKPGMLLEAAATWNISLPDSYMVGDRISDIAAGQAAGCNSILVGSHEENHSATTSPEFRCQNLLEAAHWICLFS